ncbi:MAG: biotin--[acetyl-CoA-carboxylase] ligase [Moorea sp. SIO2B7]|nr:biotin--[acetyl-CoA-carboxylase] ligase [Moorena sp. SIO2B7]
MLNHVRLSPNLVKQQLSLHKFDIIPSTNQKLWELIDQGVKLPTAAIASQQTAGRGQWGRKWQSQPGGLYLSVAVTPNIPAKNAPHLTLCSAWGIATALRNYKIPVLLKWPNDLIIGGLKLGGIKTETRIQQGKITYAVIGIGINWTNPVPDMGINLKSFFKDQLILSITSLEMLTAIVIDGLLCGYQRYLSEGINNLLPSYEKLLNNMGHSLMVEGCPGVVVGVTTEGELRVRLHSLGATTEICLQPGTISLGYNH